MPYIKQTRRLDLILEDLPQNGGELNFLIYSLMKDYIKDNGLSYKVINEIVGSLECCKLELYRRMAAPYEDLKIKENGDVL